MMPVFAVINAGSSSLKFQIFEISNLAEPRVVYRGFFEGLGEQAHLIVKDHCGLLAAKQTWNPDERFGHGEALVHLVSWTRQHRAGYKLVGLGHHVVHGGLEFPGPVLVDDHVIRTLEALVPLAPLHQPHNLEAIRIIHNRLPDLPQVACFDTSFHCHQPRLSQLFAIPKEMTERGVRRYGFHGLSYEYIASVLGHHDRSLATGRVIVAHLGNSASLCALDGGVSIATTMGFSALDGLPMSTRCGALDPGVVFYMLREMKLDADEAERILYTKSGLLGVSGISNDMRTLRELAPTNADARLAIDLFVYRIVREAGSLIAALGGIDGFVFTAGIGENDAATRAEVLSALNWVGFNIHEKSNWGGARRITRGPGPSAWVIPTNEELAIARHTSSVLHAARQRLAS
ncbi:acetate/propionate family kinase [Microvirga alba]|uniref:Acetate kinase n=1 Tax=Microvirga alba TaxID=2791025 RepID=A0A931BPY4_9HYPH|nr:acetate/propionate family kinase [Microvirga alba]MBF9232398.1 acetate/propionate family kinase [Microvirga alba]